jgi:WhiB family redox-sensing transcriptional regulator
MAESWEWLKRAACRGLPSDLFFPDQRSEHGWDEPQRICASCPVSNECLALVIDLDWTDDRWGMFGGMTPWERESIREERRYYARAGGSSEGRVRRQP